MDTWPEDLFEFAWFPNRDQQLQDLAEQVEEEDWNYYNTDTEHERPILFNYIRYTYNRVAEEKKINLSEYGDSTCFNTGLVTPNQEPVYASFEINRREGAYQPWFFKGWYRGGQWELNRFGQLPDLAHYFDDPAVLVFDTRKELRVNIEHIINETPRERFPEIYNSMTDHMVQIALEGSISDAKERVRRSYKAAIPQYYRGQVQLLLPLCLMNPQQADLALVVEIHRDFYRATTCLTLDMAYNNARLLAKPDRDWLKP